MMSGGNLNTPVGGDRLYADAVCAQCNTVNPEGTLICKTCGNNLRDQRSLRLAADQILVGDIETKERRKFLLGALPLLGILVVVWTSMNVNRIADWLVNIQRPADSGVAALWNGPDSGPWNDLSQGLVKNPVPEDALRAAIANPPLSDLYEGRYALAIQSALGPRSIGVAAVQSDGADFLFVALIGDTAEVRGRAHFKGTSISATWEEAGAFTRGQYFAVSGVALRRPDGSFSCFGQSERSETGYDFIACRLPD